ncbi:MAG: ABC-type cobalamin/Fe3+-siderophore transport system, ATPase component [Bacillota bacterium]|jgi:iron complex transport system ATP-binding protein|nr:ABC-type cobalamin/Fe3+-siderophore transport system, ATPase component [Bacillota bacterium]
MLTLKNVYAGYDGNDVLSNISLTVQENENLCILGPNGCGKTTLIKTISGLIPCKGSITIDGNNINSMKRHEIASKVAVMSQMSSIYFSYTVFDAVLLGRYIYMKNNAFSGPSYEDREFAEHCIDAVGLSKLKYKQINTLSGGQLQRVYLARTLAQDPKIILLDEPTNHLDLKHQVELIDYLKEWSKVDGHSVIGVLHDINLAVRLADDILFLNEGETQAYGKADDIISSKLLKQVYGMDVVSFMTDSLRKWESYNVEPSIIPKVKLRKIK